jgi:hypothetical protein
MDRAVCFSNSLKNILLKLCQQSLDYNSLMSISFSVYVSWFYASTRTKTITEGQVGFFFINANELGNVFQKNQATERFYELT